MEKLEKKALRKDALKNTLLDMGYSSLHLLPALGCIGLMGAVGGEISGEGAFNGAYDLLNSVGKIVVPCIALRGIFSYSYSIISSSAGEKPQSDDYGGGL